MTHEGIGVDAAGGPVIDPTENVKALMEASVLALKERQDQYAQLADEKIRRLEGELVNSEKGAILRAAHNTEIRHMESDRVDKIRSVDVANAAATAAQLLSAVTTLATTAQATAETLRNQVAATAAAVASQTERVVNPIIERLALLEKTTNLAQGRQAYSDPALADLAIEMRKLSAQSATGSGKSEGINAAWVVGLGIISLIATLIAIGSFVVGERGTVAPAPQIIYVPAPAAGVPLPTTPQPGVPR